jgi:RNA recognition motif-containing protein
MNLYVSNLAPGITEDELRKTFQAHGAVGSVTLPAQGMRQGVATGALRGYAFVAMPNKPEAVAAAAALNRRDFRGRPLGVQVARSPRLRRRRR